MPPSTRRETQTDRSVLARRSVLAAVPAVSLVGSLSDDSNGSETIAPPLQGTPADETTSTDPSPTTDDPASDEPTRTDERPTTDTRTPTTDEPTPRNLTSYPVAWPSREEGPFYRERVFLSAESATVRLARTETEWIRLRESIAAAIDGSFDRYAFAAATDFETESLVFFETRTPGVPGQLQLRRVEGVGTRTLSMRVFCFVGPLNAEGHRAMFVRLPERGTRPVRASVTYQFENDSETTTVTTGRVSETTEA